MRSRHATGSELIVMRLDKVWYEVIMSCDKVSNFRHKYCNTKMTLNLLPSEQLMEVFAVC